MRRFAGRRGIGASAARLFYISRHVDSHGRPRRAPGRRHACSEQLRQRRRIGHHDHHRLPRVSRRRPRRRRSPPRPRRRRRRSRRRRPRRPSPRRRRRRRRRPRRRPRSPPPRPRRRSACPSVDVGVRDGDVEETFARIASVSKTDCETVTFVVQQWGGQRIGVGKALLPIGWELQREHLQQGQQQRLVRPGVPVELRRRAGAAGRPGTFEPTSRLGQVGYETVMTACVTFAASCALSEGARKLHRCGHTPRPPSVRCPVGH